MKQTAIDVRREFVCEITKLMLWHIRRLLKQREVDFETAADKRVGIYPMTEFWAEPHSEKKGDTEGWQRVMAELRKVFERHDGDAVSEAAEAKGLAVLWPHLEPGIERDVAAYQRRLERSFGCFEYQYRARYFEPEPEDYLTLHVYNAYQPDSPFHHLPEMVASLREIITRAERERPDVKRVQCGTWLNSFPPFAQLFPAAWAESAHPGLPGGHTGWWGQFMDRQGGFHIKNARRFRETGRFPFMHSLCHCAISDLHAHLDGRKW